MSPAVTADAFRDLLQKPRAAVEIADLLSHRHAVRASHAGSIFSTASPSNQSFVAPPHQKSGTKVTLAGY
jgi:hypothetical protein